MRLLFVQRRTVGDDNPVVTLTEVLLKMANVGVSMTEVIQISLLVSLSILNMFQQRYNVRYFMEKEKKTQDHFIKIECRAIKIGIRERQKT